MMTRNGIKITRNQKVLILLSLFMLFLMVFTPLWQVGVNHSLEMSIREEKVRLTALGEDERILKNEIASQRNLEGESLILASMAEDLELIASAKN